MPCFGSHGGQVNGNIALLAPFHRYPRIGGCELEERLVGDQSDAILGSDRMFQLVSARNAADAAAEYDDVSQDVLLLVGAAASNGSCRSR